MTPVYPRPDMRRGDKIAILRPDAIEYCTAVSSMTAMLNTRHYHDAQTVVPSMGRDPVRHPAWCPREGIWYIKSDDWS
jgi:hypothetical protein